MRGELVIWVLDDEGRVARVRIGVKGAPDAEEATVGTAWDIGF